jgi:hydrogenase expression/formation protein HypE
MSDDNTIEKGFTCATPFTNQDRIQLAHGSGGRMMSSLIHSCFLEAFENPMLSPLNDGALLPRQPGRLVLSTDSYVVDPPFFPGGNIGDLAVNGTVNDLSVCGARALFLSVGFILEEGLAMDRLEVIVQSMKSAACQARIKIVTGDTKVVPRGKADQIFINTTGLGVIEFATIPSPKRICPGDKIIVSGTLGDHGIAVLSRRAGMEFESPVLSDSAALNHMIGAFLELAGDKVHAMRDATRGGLGAVLNEMTESAGFQFNIHEDKIPLNPVVEGACELLGLDPIYVANEGKVVVFADPDAVDDILGIMNQFPEGKNAAVIGEVTENRRALVTMTTRIGGQRIIDMPVGEQLPRIC